MSVANWSVRESGRGKERQSGRRRGRVRVRESRFCPLHSAACVHALVFPCVLSLSLSHSYTHTGTRRPGHRPREGEWESERENTSQPRCSRRFFEVRCLVVCLPSREWEWEGETFSSDLSLCLHLFLLLVFLCHSHIISMLFWFCVDTRNECACGFVCALIKACLPYPRLLWLNHAVLFQGWWVAPRLKYNQNKASDFLRSLIIISGLLDLDTLCCGKFTSDEIFSIAKDMFLESSCIL